MTKKIATDILIVKIANNLEKNFKIPNKNISNHIISLLDEIVVPHTIYKNLPDKFKRNKLIECPECGKKISPHNGSMTIHRKQHKEMNK